MSQVSWLSHCLTNNTYSGPQADELDFDCFGRNSNVKVMNLIVFDFSKWLIWTVVEKVIELMRV